MKIFKYISIVLMVFLFLSFTECTGDPAERIDTVPDYTSYEGLIELMNSGDVYYLVDVRTAEEFASGYMPGAINIPYERILDLDAEDKNVPVVLYCRSGNRAGAALSTLQDNGYSNVYNFGGFSNWEGDTAYP